MSSFDARDRSWSAGQSLLQHDVLFGSANFAFPEGALASAMAEWTFPPQIIASTATKDPFPSENNAFTLGARTFPFGWAAPMPMSLLVCRKDRSFQPRRNPRRILDSSRLVDGAKTDSGKLVHTIGVVVGVRRARVGVPYGATTQRRNVSAGQLYCMD